MRPHAPLAAEPVGLRAAASGAWGLIRSALPVLGHLHELGLLGDKGAVSSGGSTVHVVRAAEPVGLRAAAAVAAQYMLSGQQNQLASGQQPAGHEVSSGPHCLFLAIFMSWAFLATKGQSAAVAAQYMLSGQQNQLASGQQPAGHE